MSSSGLSLSAADAPFDNQLSRAVVARVRKAAKKWRELHERKVQQRIIALKDNRRQREAAERMKAVKLARHIPMDVLAREWLNDAKPNVETRAYLVDKLLPTLIIAAERLLEEVSKRGLENESITTSFNPINFLAQYLMRNNPKFAHFTDASPYMRGIRAVADELKSSVFALEENRSAKIKAEARRKREERKKLADMREAESKRRKQILHDAFDFWKSGGDGDGDSVKVSLERVQACLRSFEDFSDSFPPEIRKAMSFSKSLGEAAPLDAPLDGSSFTEYVSGFVSHFAPDVFNEFGDHLVSCGKMTVTSHFNEKRRKMLSTVFKSCDKGEIGFLDRQKILNLFELFFDEAPEEAKTSLRNPRHWPVLEIFEQQLPEVRLSAEVSDSVPESKSVDQKSQSDGENGKGTAAFVEEGKEAAANSGQTDDEKLAELEEKQETEKGIAPEVNRNDEESEKEVAGNSGLGVIHEEGKGSSGGKTVDMKATDEESVDNKVASAGEGVHGGQVLQEEDVTADEGSKEAEDPVRAQTVESETDFHKDETEGEGKGEETAGNRHQTEEIGNGRQSGSCPPDIRHSTPRNELGSRGRPRTRSRVIGPVVLETSMDSSGPGSLFDPSSLNESQFVQLLETFLGDEPSLDLTAQLGDYVQLRYGESEEDRQAKRLKNHQSARSAHNQRLVDLLFDLWDRNRSGFISLDEIKGELKKWKGIDSIAAKAHARHLVDFSDTSDNDHKLGRKELRAYIELLAGECPEQEDAFDDIVQFLLAGVELSIEEKNRAEQRGKWLEALRWTGKTSGVNFDALFKGVWKTLQMDGEMHGDGKIVNGSVGVLEERLIRFISATSDDKELMVGRKLTREMKNVSFSVVDSGKPLHVKHVATHSGVHSFGGAKGQLDVEERDGSLVIVPLKNKSRRVFGIVSIDTVASPPGKLFQQHEISFYQGIAKVFSTGYMYIDIRLKTLRITQSAVAWIHRRCSGVRQVVAYLVEPVKSSNSAFSLRKMLTTDERGESELLLKPPRLLRRENLFRDYLFKCVDHSETVTSLAYGEHHIACPLRDSSGYAMVILDINIGSMKALPPQQNAEMSRMLNLVSSAYAEVSQEVEEDEDPELVLEAESVSEESRIAIMFDRMMLVELRETAEKLVPTVFAEVKSYIDPPKVVHTILRTLLTVFCPKLEEKLEDWNECKQLITLDLLKMVATFDPTAQGQDINRERVAELLQDVPHGEVTKHGSLPAEYLYNWLYVCLSLVEHTSRMGGYKADVKK